MWNPFKKAKNNIQSSAMKMMANVAMKKMEKMSPQEREKIMREAFNPENKDKLLEAMKAMRASGQISEEQYNMAKQKLGV
jgi:hypothetical protein